MKYGIGISYDGVSARAGLFDADGKLIARGSAVSEESEGYAEASDKLASLAESLCSRTGKRAETLGVCVPAAVERRIKFSAGTETCADLPALRLRAICRKD